MTQRPAIAAHPTAATAPERGAGTLYRLVKLALAAVLIADGVVRCPCGGWGAALIGGAAGTALYAILARDASPFRPTLWKFAAALGELRRALPACRRALDVAFTAAIDEVVWRGWLTSPGIPPALRSYLAVAGCVLFALAHSPRQGVRGAATHLLSGMVFTVAVVRWGLAAAVAAHLSYNLWVLTARRVQTRRRAVDPAQRLSSLLLRGQRSSPGQRSSRGQQS
jgi:hypothetical protein